MDMNQEHGGFRLEDQEWAINLSMKRDVVLSMDQVNKSCGSFEQQKPIEAIFVKSEPDECFSDSEKDSQNDNENDHCDLRTQLFKTFSVSIIDDTANDYNSGLSLQIIKEEKITGDNEDDHILKNETNHITPDDGIDGKKRYICTVCCKTVTRPYDLKRHMKTHTGIKPYGCKVCGKTFSEQGNLQKHMRIHTGEKPYHCKICNNSFKQLGHLQGHMLTHSGQKPFTCIVCKKSFREKKSLRYHSKLHDNQDPSDLSIYI